MSKKFDESVLFILQGLVQEVETLNERPSDVTTCVLSEIHQELDRMLITLSKSKAFKPPTPLQVKEYAASIGKHIMGNEFCDFYESKGWVVGKSKMKSWKASVRNWCKNDKPLSIPTETPEERFRRLDQY